MKEKGSFLVESHGEEHASPKIKKKKRKSKDISENGTSSDVNSRNHVGNGEANIQSKKKHRRGSGNHIDNVQEENGKCHDSTQNKRSNKHKNKHKRKYGHLDGELLHPDEENEWTEPGILRHASTSTNSMPVNGQLVQDLCHHFTDVINRIPPLAYFDPDTYDEIKSVGILNESKAGSVITTVDIARSLDQLRNEPLVKEKKKPLPTTSAESSEVDTPTRAQLMEQLRKKIVTLRGNREFHSERDKLKRRLGKMSQKENKKLNKQSSSKSSEKGVVCKKEVPDEPKAEEGGLQFSKFDLSEPGYEMTDVPSSKKPRKVKQQGKNLKKLLHTAQKHEEKHKELMEKDPALAEVKEEKRLWKSVMMKAQGVKVKDDIQLIKKSAKKQDQMKRRSQKKWKERTEQQEFYKKKRETKRRDNIKRKKQHRKDVKIKKAEKKGRIIVPGF